MKSLVYESPVDSDEALVPRIAVVAGDIWKIPGVFANVRQYLRQRYGKRRKDELERQEIGSKIEKNH
ncbi:hypothetical protein TNCV_3327781 [Trichonephila clavipes]|nr:hypothetical protein TNCV_3327781 [Trichonephila clavipes]